MIAETITIHSAGLLLQPPEQRDIIWTQYKERLPSLCLSVSMAILDCRTRISYLVGLNYVLSTISDDIAADKESVQ